MFFSHLLFSSSSLLIAEWPPSSQRASAPLVESIDYHGTVLDGAVWLDACNCGVIKHWHRGFNGGLSNSLTFSAALRGDSAIYSCWRKTKEDVFPPCWTWVHSRVSAMWSSGQARAQCPIHQRRQTEAEVSLKISEHQTSKSIKQVEDRELPKHRFIYHLSAMRLTVFWQKEEYLNTISHD